MLPAMRALLAAAVATTALVLALAGGAGAQSPTLFATVGPGFSIRLADASGNRVLSLAPGTYTIEVRDQGDMHNFHLSGPGVDKATEVDGTGTFLWTVALTDGSYHYDCDAHPLQMKGDFTVGNAPPPPTTTTTTTTPPPTKKAVAYSGRVGPGRVITFSRLGLRARTVKAGIICVLTVTDRSTKHNYHLRGPGVNRATSRLGTGKVTWRFTTRRGIYIYRSDATPALRGTFRGV
jgi:hypothetical protein